MEADGTTVNDPLDIYDHEYAFEQAAKRTLADRLESLGATPYTSDEVPADRKLPRVEILFQTGDEVLHHELVENEDVDDEIVANAWRGTLTLQALVRGKPDQITILRELRANLRDVTARWRKTLDAELSHHKVIDLVSNGSTPMFSIADKGLYGATLRFTVLFGLIPGCLNELQQAQQSNEGE